MTMKFRQHIISQEETLQEISQKYYGTMDRWEEIARFNNLKYPYIVDTVEEKMENPDHLLMFGDLLLIKVSDSEQSKLITDLRTVSEYDKEEIYALALGKDLDISPIPNIYGQISTDNELLELKEEHKGDLATVRGLENVKQALMVRVLTPKGSYLGHPEFGSEVHTFIGKKNNEETATLLSLEIERTIRTDNRVEQVVLTSQSIRNNQYEASFLVSTTSLEDAFEFVVSRMDTGPVVVLDGFNENVV